MAPARSLRHDLLDALDDIGLTLRWMESRGDAIVTQWRIDRPQRPWGPPPGDPGERPRLDIDAIVIDRLADGEPERRMLVDMARVMSQIGTPRARERQLAAHPAPHGLAPARADR